MKHRLLPSTLAIVVAIAVAAIAVPGTVLVAQNMQQQQYQAQQIEDLDQVSFQPAPSGLGLLQTSREYVLYRNLNARNLDKIDIFH